jgi:hypothetical protein
VKESIDTSKEAELVPFCGSWLVKSSLEGRGGMVSQSTSLNEDI